MVEKSFGGKDHDSIWYEKRRSGSQGTPFIWGFHDCKCRCEGLCRNNWPREGMIGI